MRHSASEDSCGLAQGFLHLKLATEPTESTLENIPTPQKVPRIAERLKGLTNNPITVHFGSFGIHGKTIRTLYHQTRDFKRKKKNNQIAKPSDQPKHMQKPPKTPGPPSKHQAKRLKIGSQGEKKEEEKKQTTGRDDETHRKNEKNRGESSKITRNPRKHLEETGNLKPSTKHFLEGLKTVPDSPHTPMSGDIVTPLSPPHQDTAGSTPETLSQVSFAGNN
ncbi:hypothetical protein ElyMa_007004700 [Elysia marginata]|uniref:Uncharacterized protein n=1 Tax=Elysia marginata TaxID=1093978 RepID=A0AAV4JNY3_9GAST|nr:hypothetical protein ElyMa_007004700 [Elysia marginata]